MNSYPTHSSLAVNIRPVVPRDEYVDYMTFRSCARPLFTELFGPLVGLKEEWQAQGASPEELDLSAFRYRAPMRTVVPVNTGWIGGNDETVLEETGDYVITRDRMGRRTKLFKGRATLPLPLDYPVKSFDDWLKIKRHYLYCDERFPPQWDSKALNLIAQGWATVVRIPGGFDELRQLMGEENACLAFYDQPHLVRDVIDTITETALRVLDKVSSVIPIDELTVHEDLAGKSGPLIGPNHFDEFIAPYYRGAWELVSSRGTRLFSLDSDGNIEPLLSSFVEAGINVVYPMEPAAGMDIVAVRHRFGTRLAFMGGIDKHVLRRNRAEIERELEYKIPPMVHTGGCVISLDHRIPNGTPLDNYKFYIDKAWEIMDRESATKD
ncbi:MAG: uroporphyrinogen decarboxylase family protein [Armatimonadota bacterium]|nr:uroporphyrinogen decarboxylase family protein [Armatimonadota bacterium]